MKRVIHCDGEWLKKKFPDFERYNEGSLAMILEVIKTRFLIMLMSPEIRQECLITEIDMCKDDISSACYSLVVDGRQAQIRFRYHDIDVRGYNSWFLTSAIAFEGNEAAVLRLNQLLNAVVRECCVSELAGEVRELLSANPHHYVMIDDRRPFYSASC